MSAEERVGQALRLGRLKPVYSMTRILLRMWLKDEAGQPCGMEAMRLVQVDSARERYHGIPSIVG